MPESFWRSLATSVALHTLLLWLPLATPHPSGSHGPQGPGRLEAHIVPPRLPPRQALAEPLPLPDAVLPAGEARAEPPAVLPPTQPLPGLPGPSQYFKSSEVDQRAEPVEVGALLYPESAYLRRIEGVVTLRVFLNESGGVDAVDVIEASPAGIFEQAAVDAVLNTRFAPARLFGRPVKNVKTLEIRFDPRVDRPAPAGGQERPGP